MLTTHEPDRASAAEDAAEIVAEAIRQLAIAPVVQVAAPAVRVEPQVHVPPAPRLLALEGEVLTRDPATGLIRTFRMTLRYQ